MESNTGPAAPKPEVLGTIETVITGTRYHDTVVERDISLDLEREPENPSDGNAIQVRTNGGAQAGYLPRRIARWLAPLLDTGLVEAAVRLADRPVRPGLLAIDLTIRPTAAGARVLVPEPVPATLPDALHCVVLDTYTRAKQWESAAFISEVGERLQRLSRHRFAPETQLLLALFPALARDAAKRSGSRTRDNAAAAILAIKIGAPVHCHNLTMFPLYLAGDGARDYMLIDDALDAGLAEVKEISESGSVPEILVANRAPVPILIPDGQILSGAKQNCVINVTVIILAGTTVKVPVSCVEQGRWRHVSRHFRATHYAPPKLRARKQMGIAMRMAAGAGRASDQGQVWADVADYLEKQGIHSPTGSLTDGFEATADRRVRYRDAMHLPDGAHGVAMVSGSTVLGLDLFDDPETLARLWPRLCDAYFFEAVQDPDPRPEAEPGAVKGFLERAAAGLTPAPDSPGLGNEFTITGDGLAGTALYYGGRLRHLAVFSL